MEAYAYPSMFGCSSSSPSPPSSYLSLMNMMNNNNNNTNMENNGLLKMSEDMMMKSDDSKNGFVDGTESQAKQGKNKKGDDHQKKKKIKKGRFAFQTRSQVDILDDGYRWRKYGQKAVKNNRFPRSYYRCTYHGCNVKKQVQRLSKDEGVVVTTYEGVHSHPIEKSTDNFENILSQMQIYSAF